MPCFKENVKGKHIKVFVLVVPFFFFSAASPCKAWRRQVRKPLKQAAKDRRKLQFRNTARKLLKMEINEKQADMAKDGAPSGRDAGEDRR